MESALVQVTEAVVRSAQRSGIPNVPLGIIILDDCGWSDPAT